jgi:hypothetical protein
VTNDDDAGETAVNDERILSERRKALEDEFFAKENERLRQKLHEREGLADVKEDLHRVTGIDDDAVLERLAELGVKADTLAAIALVPLVEVAWADGKLQENEKGALLSAAKDAGIDQRHPAYELFANWMIHRPAPQMLDAWTAYVRGLAVHLDTAQRDDLREKLVGRARQIAQVAGGFLGLGNKISPEEEAALGMLERAFDGD